MVSPDPCRYLGGVNGYQPVTTDPSYVSAGIPNQPLGANVGIPTIVAPDISKGRVPLPLSMDNGYVEANKQLKRGYIESWNLIIEQKLPGDFVGSVGYVGSQSINGFAFINSNASQIPGSGNNGRPLYIKFGRTATTRIWDGRTHSDYHSLQATINRRFTSGLFLKGAYTYAHAIAEAGYGDWTQFTFNALSQLYRNKATANFDRTHNLQLAYVYELPFGAGKKWAQNGAAKAILGGWQINGIFASYSGTPFTLGASGTSLNMPGNTQTPDQIKPTIAKYDNYGDLPWFDTTAFANISEVRYGNMGLLAMRGPGAVNMDMSLFRKFRLSEKFNMEFKAEGFNISNTPHFSNPTTSITSGNFGKILSTLTNGLGDSRSFRFGLRIAF